MIFVNFNLNFGATLLYHRGATLLHTSASVLHYHPYMYWSLNIRLSWWWWLYIYIYICTYIYHHHHVPISARISLTTSRYFSQSFIAFGRSSRLHPVKAQSYCMYVLAGRPAFARLFQTIQFSVNTQFKSKCTV